MKLTETELKQLAANLRCPEGNAGIKAGEMMNATNSGIISNTIATLGISPNDSILEIGPGNGNHVQEIDAIAPGIQYKGIDISEIMVAEASTQFVDYANVSFSLSDGRFIPFDKNIFDKVFTVNTIYFWEDAPAYLNEIIRVIKPDALLSIGFIPERIMQKIPFAKYGFNLYSETWVRNLLVSSGLEVVSEQTEKEFVTSNTGEQIEREYVITTAKKL